MKMDISWIKKHEWEIIATSRELYVHYVNHFFFHLHIVCDAIDKVNFYNATVIAFASSRLVQSIFWGAVGSSNRTERRSAEINNQLCVTWHPNIMNQRICIAWNIQNYIIYRVYFWFVILHLKNKIVKYRYKSQNAVWFLAIAYYLIFL